MKLRRGEWNIIPLTGRDRQHRNESGRTRPAWGIARSLRPLPNMNWPPQCCCRTGAWAVGAECARYRHEVSPVPRVRWVRSVCVQKKSQTRVKNESGTEKLKGDKRNRERREREKIKGRREKISRKERQMVCAYGAHHYDGIREIERERRRVSVTETAR